MGSRRSQPLVQVPAMSSGNRYWRLAVVTVVVWVAGTSGLAAAQKVSVRKDLGHTLSDRYIREANKASTGSAKDRAELYPAYAVRVWAMAYALSAEPFLLAELANALAQRGDYDESWLLNSKYLRVSSNTAMRETIESSMRAATAHSESRLRTPAGYQLRAAELMQRAESAARRGALTDAQRDYGVAYALVSPAIAPLVPLARSLEEQHKWQEAYVLWEQAANTPFAEINARLGSEAQPEPDPDDEPEPGPSPNAGVESAARLTQPSPLAHQALREVARQHMAALTYIDRPWYYSYLDVQVAAVLGGRSITFAGLPSSGGAHCAGLQDAQLGVFGMSSCPSLSLPLTAGPALSVRLFPLAAVRYRAMRGLGLSGNVRLLPAAYLCRQRDAQGSCSGDAAKTDQVRIEAGVVWDYNVQNGPDSPHLQLRAEYGYDSLKIAPAGSTDAFFPLPDITYHYLSLGGRVATKLLRRGNYTWSVAVGAQFLLLLDTSTLSRPEAGGGYGAARSAPGIRLEATLARLQLTRAVYLMLDAQVDLLRIDFANSEPPALQSMAAEATTQTFFAHGLNDISYQSRLALGYSY